MTSVVPKTVILVPFSSSEPSRVIIWRHLRKWLEKTLDYPLYVGEHFPESAATYNHSLARNLAAQKAGDWEIAVIQDADTIIPTQQIITGVAAAYETGAVTYPYDERWELDITGTKMFLTNTASNWQQHMTQYTRDVPLGGCMIIRRDLWETVRGFDTGFVGWGHEDGAFAIAAQVLDGWRLLRIPGKSFHLEHVHAPAKNPNNPVYHANKARIDRYMHAGDQPDAHLLIQRLRDETIGIDTKHNITWQIPQSGDDRMDQALAFTLLRDVASVLEKYNCTYWLNDSTLLGAIRNNDFITNSKNTALGVWAADFDVRAIRELLHKYGCRFGRLQGKPDDGMLITLQRAGTHIDLYFFYPLNTSAAAKKAQIYCSSYSLLKPYATSNQAQRFDYIYPDFMPLVRSNFRGLKFWIPKKATHFLEATYGKSWNTLQEERNITLKPLNIEPRGIVPNMSLNRQAVEQYLKLHR